MVVIDLSSLSGERIADLSAMEEHDIILNTEGEGLTTVHNSSNGDISQGKVDTSLTDTSSIEMLRGDGELSCGKALTYFYKFAAAIGSKAVII